MRRLVLVFPLHRQYSKKRHDLYGVFLQIPIGVTRGLASMSLKVRCREYGMSTG